ncbi:MAG: cyclase family protein [Myxococcales bacterium]|nr:cyclase family protein [Myxococcales bacterium]
MPEHDPNAVRASSAPRPVGAYPHARRVGELIYVSGMGPRQAGTDLIPGGPIRDAQGNPLEYDVAAQTRAVIENIARVLERAGSSLADVVDVTVFLVDMARDFADFNTVYGEMLGPIGPTRTTVQVGALPTPIAVELKVIARPPAPVARPKSQGLIDISPTLSPRTAVWPGDVAFSREVSCAIEDGANIDLSSIRTTVHVGAHADAPSHYVGGGATIEQRPLERYYGPCQVVRVAVGRGERVLPRHLPGPIEAPRVLIHTGTMPDPDRFDTDFASLSPELVDHLADHGVVLVGIDTPSVDLFDDKVLLTHQALARRDMAVLEGLVLEHVRPGAYTLIALPLKLEGADASPVRAVLI